jgi:hypothetical protein
MNELKAQRDEIERATLLTKEEAEEIRRWSNQRVRETEEDNRRLRDELQTLKKNVVSFDGPKGPSPAPDDPLIHKRKEIERQNIESEAIEAELKLKEARERLNSSYSGRQANPLSGLAEGARQLLKHIAEKGGSLPLSEVKACFPNEKAVRVDSFVDQALELKLIESARNDRGSFDVFLTANGRKYVVNTKLV